MSRSGMKGHSNVDRAQLTAVMNEAVFMGMELAQPALWFCHLPSDAFPPYLIPGTFGKVRAMTFFLSTLGEEIDLEIQRLADQGKVLKAVILDSWASESLERMNARFDHRYPASPCRTRRFSPGYGDIHLKCNAMILEILGVDKVRAHPKSGALIPRKSTVCMIGWKETHHGETDTNQQNT